MHRQVKTCDRCRQLKVRCDRLKPVCRRCSAASADCSFQAPPLSGSQSMSTTDASPCTSSSSISENLAISAQTHFEAAKQTSATKGKPRLRACLSCVRCHRLKVKCDKALPCNRCKTSGFGRQCEYTHRVETSPAPDIHNYPAEGRVEAVAAWHSRLRGPSHWKELVYRVEALSRLVSPAYRNEGERPDATSCSIGACLPLNYPFSGSGCTQYSSLAAVRSLIRKHAGRCDGYIEAYMAMIHQIHPIVSPTDLREKMSEFWREEVFDDPTWLAQICMILAIGTCFAAEPSETTRQFCLAGEACLSRTAFMVSPSLNTLRTMCLMLMAKLITSTTCWASDSCWTLVGFMIRQAAWLGLHRPPRTSHEYYRGNPQEWQTGQMIWVTILYFSIQSSLKSGMCSLLHVDDVLQTSEAFGWPLNETEQVWQTTIRSSFAVVLQIIKRVNSEDDKLSYEEIVGYKDEIRQFMSTTDSYQHLDPILRIALNVYFRRALLVLHRHHALDDDAPHRYPVSYWSSLECSLALLVHHREMAGGEMSQHFGVTVRFFMIDFFGAALTACIHLLRHDAPLADGVTIPPRQTIYDTLEACVEIWAREETTSVCYRSGCRLLQSIFHMLPATRA